MKELIDSKNKTGIWSRIIFCALYTHAQRHTHKHVNLSNHTFSPTLQTPVFCGFFPNDDCLGLCQLSLSSPRKWLDYSITVLFMESLEDGFVVLFDDDSSAVTALWFMSVKTHRIKHFTFPWKCRATLIFLEQKHMRSKMSHRGEVSWREGRISIRSDTTDLRTSAALGKKNNNYAVP